METKTIPRSKPGALEKRLKRFGVTIEELSLSPKELARPRIGVNWGNKSMDNPHDAVKAVRILVALKNYMDLKDILNAWLYKDPRYYDAQVPIELVPGTEKAVAIALKALERTDPHWVDKYNAKIGAY